MTRPGRYQVKQYIFSKVYNKTTAGNDNIASEDRPVLPITFASISNSFSSKPVFSLDDDLFSDLEPYPFMEPARQLRPCHTPTPRVTSPSVSESPTETLALYPRTTTRYSPSRRASCSKTTAYFCVVPSVPARAALVAPARRDRAAPAGSHARVRQAVLRA